MLFLSTKRAIAQERGLAFGRAAWECAFFAAHSERDAEARRLYVLGMEEHLAHLQTRMDEGLHPLARDWGVELNIARYPSTWDWNQSLDHNVDFFLDLSGAKLRTCI